MPVFLEKVILPVLAAVLMALTFVNPMQFDWLQRISLFIAIIAFAFFLSHTLHLRNEALRLASAKRSDQISVPPPAQVQPRTTGNAETTAPKSPAVTGDGNTIIYDQPRPPRVSNRTELSPGASIQQSSTGDCSPNNIGSGNTFNVNCAEQSKVTATPQVQRQTGNPDMPWEVYFTISSTGIVQTGDLRLTCSGPVIRAEISRINPANFNSGSNGPDKTDPNTVVYELGPEILSPGRTVTIGVYSKEPVLVLSGSIGPQKILFSK